MQTELPSLKTAMSVQDLDRIRFVARHFEDLQGLRAGVPMGVALIGFALGEALSGTPRFVCIAAFGGGALWLRLGSGAYYRRTFGEVERPSRRGTFLGTRRENLQMTLRGLLGILLFVAALGTESRGGCPFYPIGGWALLDDWLRREQPPSQAYLPVLASVCCALAAASRSPSSILPVLTRPGIAISVVALAYVAAGLLDHRLLVQTMGLHGVPAAEASPEEER